jgi:alanine racemase
MYESSVIEISREALRSNIQFMQQRTGNGVKFCSVVKGNAYGHGLIEFVKLAMECGVSYFGVYSSDEAYKIISRVKNPPQVYIMGMVENEGIKWAVSNAVEFNIGDEDRLETAMQYAKELNTPAKIHVEVETGMNRTGFNECEFESLAEKIRQNKAHLDVVGICTHFAGAESMSNHFRVSKQIERFNCIKEKLSRLGLQPAYHHSACSAAVMNYPETIGNMVRVGIMQYGFWPNDETYIRFTGEREHSNKFLKRLITWKSHVMNVRQINKGEYIGYGTSFLANTDMRLAIIPVGYAHGYSRNLSNSGKVLIRGEEAPVVGIVNMNAITVDVTLIDAVTKGDEVILIGTQQNKTISVYSFSELSHQLNYEMLTRLSVEIPRLIVD